MSITSAITLVTLLASLAFPATAMNSMRGGPLPRPLFPGTNWWNLDISTWPVDPQSASYVSFINNGGTRRLHPDFGGNADDGSAIYGMPYAVVSGAANADLRALKFLYWDESDGVNYNTGQGIPFYPIPPEAIQQPYWIEGGDPGNMDLRGSQDRHLLIVDRDRNYLYELYNVFYDAAEGQWYAGSGAFFDMNTNNRRPDGWTSADAAGLAILPGLVRYDEVYDPNVTEIEHAFRVTVRSTNGYVYPASHRAGSTPGALPMGARLRLKSSVDVTTRTGDANVQRIFRAMQKHGLIVADNGSDLYVTGTYDTRWNNDVLNPAFRNLAASDFEVIQLGYNPSGGSSVALGSLSVAPANVTGGQSAIGNVTLTGPAPTGGAVVNIVSANPAATVPSAVTIPGNGTTGNFAVNTQPVAVTTTGNISVSYGGMTKSATITVNPAAAPALSSLTLNPAAVVGGKTSVGTVNLTKPAPAGGVMVRLTSSNPAKAKVPSKVTVTQGASSKTFNITTVAVSRRLSVTISAGLAGMIKNAILTVSKR